MHRTSFLELKYGEGKVIEPFLRRLFAERNPKRVFWVSPWLTHFNFRTSTTEKLLSRLEEKNVNIVLITREPECGSRHEGFVGDVRKLTTASIFFMPTLHAKFYLAETKERRYGLLGSANMYEWSIGSYEVGVVIESRGEGELLLEKLEELAIELRLTSGTIKG